MVKKYGTIEELTIANKAWYEGFMAALSWSKKDQRGEHPPVPENPYHADFLDSIKEI